jgi:protein-L-isoaspartate(D-aspartate) O-methyltransferase
VTKRDGKLIQEPLQATLFVPMTGAAEEKREVLPDPMKPQIFNGDFEQVFGEKSLPVGWHYLRQAVTKQDGEGNRYLAIANKTLGKPTRALQGFAIDGREIRNIKLSARIRGKDLGPDPQGRPTAAIVVTFYDQRRAVIENQVLGPWTGTFDWRMESRTLRVPVTAREAIVRLGLLEGTGELAIDQLALEVTDTP